MEYFKKVYIKSEVDLPSNTGFYFVHKHSFSSSPELNSQGGINKFRKDRKHSITHWLKYYDWYLLPVSLPDKDAIIQKQEWCDFCGELHEGNCSDNAKKRIANLKKQ